MAKTFWRAVNSGCQRRPLCASLYTSFPYSAYSDGVKFYYVNRTFLGAAELKEVDGTVAESTPVIVKCAGVNPSDNRLYVGGSGISMSDNCLSGTYFNCDKGGHENFTTYDPKTMREFGRCADGSFGFITADIETIPANTAYLKVTPDAPSEVKIMSTEEFDLYYKYHTAVESVGVDSDESSDVYSATGILLHKNATPGTDKLPSRGIVYNRWQKNIETLKIFIFILSTPDSAIA